MGETDGRVLRILELEPEGEDRYVAGTPAGDPFSGRLFGGQVASQALRAATLTVDGDRTVHSLHAYFIRPGRAGEPLVLDVDRTRDGRSFTTRRVTASQSSGPIFVLASSFAVHEEGEDWQPPAPLDVPAPEATDPEESFFASFWRDSPFDVRPVHGSGEGQPLRIHPLWVRTKEPLPDDPALHACALAFCSDMGVVGSARARSAPFVGASLDHAVWFHRPARLDEWILFSVEPASNSGARGLARGTMHTAQGVLVASIAQEALLRDTGRVPLP